MIRYQLAIDTKVNGRWVAETYSTYETILEAAEAFRYLAHHNGELGKLMSIREVSAA